MLLGASIAVSVITGCVRDKPRPPCIDQDVLRRSVDTYAALTSYADEGTSVESDTGTGKTQTTHFAVKLQRPDKYRIELKHQTTPSITDVIWSTARGNFYTIGNATKDASDIQDIPATYKDFFSQKRNERSPEELRSFDRSTNLAIAGRAGLISKIFFYDRVDGSILHSVMQGATREEDEKIGQNDCYVFFSQNFGTREIWIGKNDLVVHQYKETSSGRDFRKILENTFSSIPNPKSLKLLKPEEDSDVLTIFVTYTNIVLNPQLTEQDFEKDFPSSK